MKPLRRGWDRFKGALLRNGDHERAEEFALHVDLLTEENVRNGMSRDEARRQAGLTFGKLASTQEACRDQRGMPRLEAFAIDLRHAWRALWKSPGFALAVVVTLAIAIGANTAIFSLVNQALLHPRGVNHPERIVSIRERYGKLKMNSISISAPAFHDVRDAPEVFQYTAAANGIDLTYTGSSSPHHFQGFAVSAEWFDVLGARPILGRTFTAEEDQENANRVVILSYPTWMKVFGADPAVVNRTIELDHVPYKVIGVMGDEFDWPRQTAVWVPLALPQRVLTPQNRFSEYLFTIARLRDGVQPEQADSWLQLLSAHVLDSDAPGAQVVRTLDWGMFSESFTQSTAGDTKKPMLLLLAAVGIVLLIAASNVAGLIIARNAARSHELAVQAALGASRARLLSRTVAESLQLALLGTVFGLGFAYAGMKALLLWAPAQVRPGLGAHLDFTTLTFTIGISIAAGFFFGVLPSWHASMAMPFSAMKGAGRVSAKQKFRSTLVVVEAALALLLMIAAGALLRSFLNLERVQPGFNAEGAMTAMFSFPQASYPTTEKQQAFYREVLERLPKPSAIGLGTPFTSVQDSGAFGIEGRELTGDPAGLPHGDMRLVTTGYVETLRIPLRRGRTFETTDRADGLLVAMIDENLAAQYWPNEDPIGKRIRTTEQESPWYMIVGVVGHVLQSDLAMDSGRGMVYFNLLQSPRRIPFATAVTPASREEMQAAVIAVDPGESLYDVQSLGDRVAASLDSRKFVLRMMTVFAAIALFLSAIGLFGVISYSVTQRTKEIGIRMALGARPVGIYGMILGNGLRLIIAGVAIGLTAGFGLARMIESQLYHVRAFDPMILIGTVSMLTLVTLAASLYPAIRAAGVDPVLALRAE
jgi:predicted permease